MVSLIGELGPDIRELKLEIRPPAVAARDPAP